MYHCPICGKDSNRKGNAFTDPSNVAAHIDGCHDSAHKGVSGEQLRDEIEATEDSRSDEPDSPESGVNDPPPESRGRSNGPVSDSLEDDSEPAPSSIAANDDDEPEDAITLPGDEFEELVHSVETDAYAEGYTEGATEAYEVGKIDGQQEVEQEVIDIDATVAHSEPSEPDQRRQPDTPDPEGGSAAQTSSKSSGGILSYIWWPLGGAVLITMLRILSAVIQARKQQSKDDSEIQVF